MAIIITGKTQCSICGEVHGEGQRLYATSHFLGPEHPLHRYSDSGMHWECFESWKSRDEFVEAWVFVVTNPDPEWGSYRAYSGQHCSVILRVLEFPDDPDSKSIKFECRRAVLRKNPGATVWIHATGLSFDTTLADWDEWLSEELTFDNDWCGDAWRASFAELQSLPSEELMTIKDSSAAIEAWNTRAERDLLLEHKRIEESRRLFASHNEKFHAHLRTRPDCPYCGGDFHNLKYYDNRGNQKNSIVICQGCARSSRLSEFLGASPEK